MHENGRGRSVTAVDERIQTALHAIHGLTLLQGIFDDVTPSMPALQDAWVPWRNLVVPTGAEVSSARAVLVRQIAECDDWTALVEPLEHYWECHGTGSLARYHALRWLGVDEGLQGI